MITAAKAKSVRMSAGYAPIARVASLLVCLPLCLLLACHDRPQPPADRPRAPEADAAPDAAAPDAAAPDAALDAEPGPGLAVLVASPFAQASAPADLQEGQAHRAAGRLGLARVHFERFVTEQPEHPLAPEARLVLGDLLHRGGLPEQAMIHFARAGEILHEIKDVAFLRAARSATAARRHGEALQWAARVDPTTREGRLARDLKVDALLALRRPAEAAALMYETLAGQVPGENARAWLRLAEALVAAGQVPEAISALRSVALRHVGQPVSEQAHKRMRRLRWQVPAKTWVARTLPRPEDVLLRGRALLDDHEAGAVETEVLAFLQETTASPGTEAWCDTWWLLARARSKQRRHADAAAAYDRVADDCPEDPRAPEALFAEARAWFTENDHTHALDALERLRTTYPEHSLAGDALTVAARVHRELGEPEAARDHLLRLLHDHPDDDMAVEALWGLFQDDPERVAAVDPALVEREPDQRGRLHYFRGVQAAARGDAAGASRAWQAAVRQAPMSYYALLALNRLRETQPTEFPGILDALMAVPVRPPPAAMFAGPRREQGLVLLQLGFFADAWWAFTEAGSGPYDRGRYRAGLAHLFALSGAEASARLILAREVSELDDAWPVGDERDRFDAVYPHDFIELVQEQTTTRGLPPALLFGLVRTESRFDPTARSWAGACGLVQLLPATARDLARAEGVPGPITCRRLFRPEIALRLGARYLQDLRDRFGDHPGLMVAGYHAGPGNLERFVALPERDFAAWVEALPFGATRLYVKRVLQAWWVYAWLLADPAVAPADRVPVVPRLRP
jgi:soluble lytic murein transglycosylase